jgi:glycosyltransferase involved in cell wall biosynthesis
VKASLKIALMGTRGIPANYGGFETCVEEVGARLAARGHEVTVYSKHPTGSTRVFEYRGMRNIYLPRPQLSGVETVVGTALSIADSLFRGYDIHMLFNGANSPLVPCLRIFGKHVVLNTDGLEWQRDKWGSVAKKYYKLSEKVSARVCKHLVSDSDAIHDYYARTHGVDSTIIAYGANLPAAYSSEEVERILSSYGLVAGKYFIQVTRFEPENQPLFCMNEFVSLKMKDIKYVLVGGSRSGTKYMDSISSYGDSHSNLCLPGFIYDKRVLEILMTNSFAYVHGNRVGGTNPALLQAMAAGRPVIAADCVFNREVLGELGIYFESERNSLAKGMMSLFDDSDFARPQVYSNIVRIMAKYNWDLIADKYEALFLDIVRRK